MKRSLALAFVVLLLLAVAIPVGAASWDEKINGGMSYSPGYGEFTVTLSAFERSDGSYTGQGQYYYPPLDRTFHLEVSKVCFGYDDGYRVAVAIGPVFGQDGTTVSVGYGAIAVKDFGADGPDRLRVWFDTTWAVADGFCTNLAYGVFPAIVGDGEFHIKGK